MTKLAYCLVSAVAVAHLAGCAAAPDAMVQTLKSIVSRDGGTETAQLNPNFQYLRVTIGGRAALLVLGYVEQDALGPIEVWYSAEREVLKLQNGRVVGAIGMLTEWRNVKLSNVPQWSAIARMQAPRHLARTRDVMPGYRYGVRESLALAPVAAPAKSALRDLDPDQLTWFEERVEGATGGESALPPARYAVSLAGGAERVVYGEQCLSPDLCFTWQRWPAGK